MSRPVAILVAAALLAACTLPQSLALSLLPDGTFLVPLQNLQGSPRPNVERLAALEAKGDWAGVLAIARSAVARDPLDAEWWYVKGSAEARLGEWTAARESFGTCVRLDPSDLDAWQMLAQSQGRSGDRAAAIRTLERALDVSRESPVTFFFLGEQYRLTGQRDAAIHAYREALRRRADFGEARAALERLEEKAR